MLAADTLHYLQGPAVVRGPHFENPWPRPVFYLMIHSNCKIELHHECAFHENDYNEHIIMDTFLFEIESCTTIV